MLNFIDSGFAPIPEAKKTRYIQDLFQRVAPHYDLMNDLMSFGLHRLWKHMMVMALKLSPQAYILDAAGGTGDISLRVMRYYPHLDLTITVCDLTPSMMEKGRSRTYNQGITQGIRWISGRAEQLPLSNQSMDVYLIAFGLRNVTDLNSALTEAARVLKPGGQFICLEFSPLKEGMLSRLYDIYSFTVLPWLGSRIAKDRAAYQYLVESIRCFPDQETLKARIQTAGFKMVNCQNWFGGIVVLHTAIV